MHWSELHTLGSPGQGEHHPGLECVVIEPGGVLEDVSEGAQGDCHPLSHPSGGRPVKLVLA